MSKLVNNDQALPATIQQLLKILEENNLEKAKHVRMEKITRTKKQFWKLIGINERVLSHKEEPNTVRRKREFCPLGARFSKVPKSLIKSQTLWLQSFYIHIWIEAPFIQDVSGVYTWPLCYSIQIYWLFWTDKFPGLSTNGPLIWLFFRVRPKSTDILNQQQSSA